MNFTQKQATIVTFTVDVLIILQLRNNEKTLTLLFTERLSSPVGTKFSKRIEDMSKEELNECLKCFYTSARKKDGTYYKNTSMKSIRAAIDRFLRSPPHNKPFSIISDAVFTGANKVLSAFFTLENFQNPLFTLYLTG